RSAHDPARGRRHRRLGGGRRRVLVRPAEPASVAAHRGSLGNRCDATYPIFFAGTNGSFLRGGLSDSEVQSLLDRWATWHRIRTGLGVAGFIASLRALQES